MTKIKNISGFPEWLPEQKIVEERLLETIRGIYRSFGFTPLETPAVELLSTLAAHGEIDKQIYVLKRLQAVEEEEADLGLHFDLTVPLARYVAQHLHALDFPFKRYQLQKVWRGERPQKGRSREFYQLDIDIIGRDTLPLSCDAEVLTIIDRVCSSLGAGQHVIKINNRKILYGIYTSLGLDQIQRQKAITAVDKISKVGKQGVMKELLEIVEIGTSTAERIVDLTEVRIKPGEVDYVLSKLDIDNKMFYEGKEDLLAVVALLSVETGRSVELDLSLARGLDYYTGTVMEVHLQDHPRFGSIAGGGRYEDLASRFINKKLPGVGVSFGFTRFLEMAFAAEFYGLAQKTPSRVLVAVYGEKQRLICNEAADQLRAMGISCEVFFGSPRLGKQLDYAAAKGIAYVLFIDEQGGFEVKDLATKEQLKIRDLDEWSRGLIA